MEETLNQAIKVYGPDMQQNIAIEEMSELTKEICKVKRGMGSKLNLAEEIADVEIMIQQLKIIHDVDSMVDVFKIKKIERLKERLSH